MSLLNHSLLRIMELGILTKKDLENMLGTNSISQAIKTIADKPIGLYLYEKTHGRKTSLKDIFKYIDLFEYNRIMLIYRGSDEKTKKSLDIFISFFDTVNTIIVLNSILSKKTPSFLYHIGFYALASNISNLEELYEKAPQRIKPVIREAILTKGVNVESLLGILPTRREISMLPHSSRIIYGVFNDFFIIKNSILMGKILEPRVLVLLSRDEYKVLCEQKSIDGLINILRTGNTYMNTLSEIMFSLKKIYTGFSVIDAASIIYATYRVNSLLHGVVNLAIRLLLLSIGEAFYLRNILTSIDTGINRSVIDELIHRWWPL